MNNEIFSFEWLNHDHTNNQYIHIAGDNWRLYTISIGLGNNRYAGSNGTWFIRIEGSSIKIKNVTYVYTSEWFEYEGFYQSGSNYTIYLNLSDIGDCSTLTLLTKSFDSIIGNFASCDDLVVEGHFAPDLNDSDPLGSCVYTTIDFGSGTILTVKNNNGSACYDFDDFSPNPTVSPSNLPSFQPSGSPSILPSIAPRNSPSNPPSSAPSTIPTTRNPTLYPTLYPFKDATYHPSMITSTDRKTTSSISTGSTSVADDDAEQNSGSDDGILDNELFVPLVILCGVVIICFCLLFSAIVYMIGLKKGKIASNTIEFTVNANTGNKNTSDNNSNNANGIARNTINIDSNEVNSVPMANLDLDVPQLQTADDDRDDIDMDVDIDMDDNCNDDEVVVPLALEGTKHTSSPKDAQVNEIVINYALCNFWFY